jgi:hypothetical protein
MYLVALCSSVGSTPTANSVALWASRCVVRVPGGVFRPCALERACALRSSAYSWSTCLDATGVPFQNCVQLREHGYVLHVGVCAHLGLQLLERLTQVVAGCLTNQGARL